MLNLGLGWQPCWRWAELGWAWAGGLGWAGLGWGLVLTESFERKF